MSVTTYDMEVESAVPAAKLYQSFILEGDSLILKVAPQTIKSVKILQGDGGAGTIKLLTFGEGRQYTSVKQKIDAVDKEKMTCSYSIIEDDDVIEPVEVMSFHIKVVATDGGCIFKKRSIYTAKVPEQHIKIDQEKAKLLFKAVEAYLLAN